MAGFTERGDWLYKQEMDGIQYKFKVFALGIKMGICSLFQDREYQKRADPGDGREERERISSVYNEIELRVGESSMRMNIQQEF